MECEVLHQNMVILSHESFPHMEKYGEMLISFDV